MFFFLASASLVQWQCPLTPIGQLHKLLTYVEYRAVSVVFLTTDPPPPLPLASVSSPRTKVGGGYTLAERWGGGGSIFRKTPDIELGSYSIIPLRSTSSNSSVFLLSSASVVQWQCARTPVSQRFLDLRRRQQGGCVQGSFKIEQKHHFTIVDCNLNFKLMSVSCPLPR